MDLSTVTTVSFEYKMYRDLSKISGLQREPLGFLPSTAYIVEWGESGCQATVMYVSSKRTAQARRVVGPQRQVLKPRLWESREKCARRLNI